MFCPNCGNQNPDGAVFCGACGQKMPSIVSVRTTPPQQTATKVNVQSVNNTQPGTNNTVRPNPQPQPGTNNTVPPRPQPAIREKKKFNVLFVLIPLLLLFLLILSVTAGIIIFRVIGNNTHTSPTQADENVQTENEVIELVTEKVPLYSTYEAVKSDDTWIAASYNASAMGGELVSINSASEFREVCALADNMGLKVFWVGAEKTYYDWEHTDWLDGSPMKYTCWYPGEPSYQSEEGKDESYLMVFKVKDNWYFNDAQNDVSSFYKGKMGYIIEYAHY